MEKFRHKTNKDSFRTPYFLAAGVNVIFMGGTGMYYYSKGGPDTQAKVVEMFNSPLGKAIRSEAKKIIRKGGR